MRNDVYGNPDIVTRGNITAKVYSPILTEKERDKRMTAIKKATVSLVRSKRASKD